jgi:hypothetical protein
MSGRVLAAVPPLLAAALVVLFDLLGLGPFNRGLAIVVKLLTAGACLAAMRQFAPRDYFFKAWLATALNYSLLAVASVAHVGDDPRHRLIRAVVEVAANVLAVVAVLLFAYALRVAGLLFPGSFARRLLLITATVLIAVLLTGSALGHAVQELLAGDGRGGATDLATNLGDAIPIVLLAPLALTAFSFRDGPLGAPFGFYAAGMFCWLIYDAAVSLLDGGLRDGIGGTAYLAACLYIAAAATAHVLASRRARLRLQRPAVSEARAAAGQGPPV